MKLTAKQTKAYRSALSGEKQFILFGGAIRGGKTYWLLLTFISLCSKFPKSRWVIIRESLPTLKRTTLVTFKEIINQGLAPHIESFNQDTFTVTFTNKSELIFMPESYDQDKDLNRFRGLEINGGGIDEINECHEQMLYKLFERSGTWLHAQPDVEGNTAPIIILATCNPAQNWIKDVVYDKWKSDTLPKSWQYIPSKITDNPHIPLEYIESLRENLPPYEFQKFVEGDWDVAEKAVNPFFLAYEPVKHESESELFDPLKPILISLDFNLQPFCGIVCQYFIDDKGIHRFRVVDEISVVDGSIPKMIDAIKLRYGAHLASCFLTGDAMGNRGDLSQRDNANYYEQIARGLGLKDRQMVVPRANPTHENSRAECNFVLQNFPDFKISPNCKGVRRDVRSVECDAAGSIIKKNRKIISQQADMADCLRYAINTFLGEWYAKELKRIGYNRK